MIFAEKIKELEAEIQKREVELKKIPVGEVVHWSSTTKATFALRIQLKAFQEAQAIVDAKVQEAKEAIAWALRNSVVREQVYKELDEIFNIRPQVNTSELPKTDVVCSKSGDAHNNCPVHGKYGMKDIGCKDCQEANNA